MTQSPLEVMMGKHKAIGWRRVSWLIMLLLLAAITWASVAERDLYAIAQGEVDPREKDTVIQHLEGGIVEAIHVSEGDLVDIGTPLIQLDLATSGVNIPELLARLEGQQLLRARLEAEADGLDAPIFPPALIKSRPSMVEEEMQAFKARKSQLISNQRTLAELVRQRELAVEEVEARKNAVERNLKLSQERLKMSKSLLSKGLTAKMEHLTLEAEVEDLEGQRRSLVPALPRAQAAVKEARSRMEESAISFRREAQEELGLADQTIARLEELLSEAQRQGIRAEIKSPVRGAVENIRQTIGGVVRPGEPIMQIVSTDSKLVVDAKLAPEDRGHVSVGQQAVVKISAYDYNRYGGLSGHVTAVAPDAITDEATGIPYFRVIVETDKVYLGENEGELPISPGMQATVDIHTGSRSFLSLLLKPIFKIADESFRET